MNRAEWYGEEVPDPSPWPQPWTSLLRFRQVYVCTGRGFGKDAEMLKALKKKMQGTHIHASVLNEVFGKWPEPEKPKEKPARYMPKPHSMAPTNGLTFDRRGRKTY